MPGKLTKVTESLNGVKLLLGIFALLTVIDVIQIHWEGRPAAYFFESLAAILLYWATACAAFAIAVWAGRRVGRHTSRVWLGWIVGISVFVAAVRFGDLMIKEIPGVGWRIKMMQHAREDALLDDGN